MQEMIELSAIIQIKRVLKDGQTSDLIEFKEANIMSFVHQFYQKRGLTNKQSNETNAVTIRVLRYELLQEIERLRKMGNDDVLPEYQMGYAKLDEAILTLKKGDQLILINHNPVII